MPKERLAAAPLGDRIAELLGDPTRTLDRLETMLEAVAPELDRLTAEAAAALQLALDPRQTSSQVVELRGQATEIEWQRARLERAAETLGAEITERRADADAAARRARYRSAETASRAVAAKLRERWPSIMLEVLQIIDNIRAADALVSEANADLPPDAAPLVPTQELAGRYNRSRWGFSATGSWDPHATPVQIVDAVLPGLDGRAIWPVSYFPGGQKWVPPHGATELARWVRDGWHITDAGHQAAVAMARAQGTDAAPMAAE